MSQAKDHFDQANNLFVDEDFSSALAKYTEAINADSSNPEFFLKRSQCHLKLNDFNEALSDANSALQLQPKSWSAYLRKGIALFNLGEYESARGAFHQGNSIESQQQFKTWIRKCDAELESENTSQPQQPTQTPPPQQPLQEPQQPPPQKQDLPPPAPSAKVAEVPRTPTYRHEWYQSPTHVFLTIFIKNVPKENATIDVSSRKISIVIKLPTTDSEFQLNLKLCDEIVPEETVTTFLATKIEIKLKKVNASQWTSLECSNDQFATRPYGSLPSDEKKPTYPSSSLKAKDWDEVARSIKDEKLDGEDGLNKVFQDIFSNGSDEQKRAMMKSFTESGGTVLSTNWDDVKKKHVDGSPPKGMEMHKWND